MGRGQDNEIFTGFSVRYASGERDEIHPYDPERGVWTATCTAAGCGLPIDEWPTLPPLDLMCADCEQREIDLYG